MIVRHASERGHTQQDWLDSRHTFSFGNYYDPNYTSFRTLRVINEDIVQPGTGFGMHSHRDMEIISYILEGTLEHKDSMGHTGQIKAGEVQRMSAGTGVQHSESNPSTSEPVHFLQIWIEPKEKGLTPSYETREFNHEQKHGELFLIANQHGKNGVLTIHQDVAIYEGKLAGKSDRINFKPAVKRHAWIQVIQGSVVINGHKLKHGDGVAISSATSAEIQANPSGRILVFDMG